MIDNSGLVQNTIVYNGFGNITSESNASFGDRYKWTGREWDAEAELQYNRARFYDPAVGKWISRDPLGFEAGDSNLYRYVNNQPVMKTDPSGLQFRPMFPICRPVMPIPLPGGIGGGNGIPGSTGIGKPGRLPVLGGSGIGGGFGGGFGGVGNQTRLNLSPPATRQRSWNEWFFDALKKRQGTLKTNPINWQLDFPQYKLWGDRIKWGGKVGFQAQVAGNSVSMSVNGKIEAKGPIPIPALQAWGVEVSLKVSVGISGTIKYKFDKGRHAYVSGGINGKVQVALAAKRSFALNPQAEAFIEGGMNASLGATLLPRFNNPKISAQGYFAAGFRFSWGTWKFQKKMAGQRRAFDPFKSLVSARIVPDLLELDFRRDGGLVGGCCRNKVLVSVEGAIPILSSHGRRSDFLL